MRVGVVAGAAIQIGLGIAVFVIAYRRNRLHFHGSVQGAIGIALAAALVCPIGVLLYYGVTVPVDRRQGRRRKP